MILAELRDYVKTKQIVSMTELVAYFHADPNTIREMLDVWIRKQKIQRLQMIPHKCDECTKQCQMQTTEFYEWIAE